MSALLNNFKKAIVHPQGHIETPWFRGSFMSVFEFEKPMDAQKQPYQYSVTALFDPSEVNIDPIISTAEALAKTKFRKVAGVKLGHRDGDEKEHLDGYAGMTYIRMTTKKRFKVVDQYGVEIKDDPEGAIIYSGAYYRAYISPWTYDTSGNKGVSWNLLMLQKLCDGEPFSVGTDFGSIAFDAVAKPEDVTFDDIPF